MKYHRPSILITSLCIVLLLALTQAVEAQRDETPLHTAARNGDLETVENLLAEGLSPLPLNTQGQTPIDLAVQQGRPAIFWSLYRATEALDSPIETRLPEILNEVVARDHAMLLASLLDPGQGLNHRPDVRTTVYFKAAEQGSLSVLKYLFEEGQDLNQASPTAQWTALHFLAQGGHHKALRWILTQDLAIQKQDARGLSPLHLAAFMGHENVARLLLEAGVLVDTTDEHQRTPLHIAAHQGYGALIQTLLQHGASPELKTTQGQTPLDIVRARHFSALRTLFPAHTATPPSPSQDYVDTLLALRSAIQQKDTTTIPSLLSTENINLRALDRYGLTLLHYASDVGDHQTIQALLQRGIDVNQPDTQSQWTPLMYAVANGDETAITTLLEAGADLHTVNATGWTALHIAEFLGQASARALLETAGARDDIPNELGHTPSQLALTGSQYRAKQQQQLGRP